MAAKRSKHTGIEIRPSKTCLTKSSARARCSCTLTYRAEIFSARDGRKLRRSFASLAAAKAWRSDAQVALRQGKISAAASSPLEVAAAAWVAGARVGAIRNRSGDVYKPSVVRGYEQSLRLRILPDFGKVPLKDVRVALSRTTAQISRTSPPREPVRSRETDREVDPAPRVETARRFERKAR